MKTTYLTLAGMLLASNAFAVVGHDTSARTSDAVAVSDPDYVVIDEDWWVPLRMEPSDALNDAREYYRRDNERAAADEIRKAASWVSYASMHALPHTKQALLSARTGLLTLADDLETGKVRGAARMDATLADASHALAQWHYYRARDEYGKHDSITASRDLEAAAANLENAARSAHLQFGPDTITVFEDIYEGGRTLTKERTIDNDVLGMHLDGIKKAIDTMADALTRS